MSEPTSNIQVAVNCLFVFIGIKKYDIDYNHIPDICKKKKKLVSIVTSV